MAGERHLRTEFAGEHESTSTVSPPQTSIWHPQSARACDRQQCPPAGFGQSGVAVPFIPSCVVVQMHSGPLEGLYFLHDGSDAHWQRVVAPVPSTVAQQ